MSSSNNKPWNEVVFPGKNNWVEPIDPNTFHCKCAHGVCCIVPRLLKRIHALEERTETQQEQIDALVLKDQYAEETNNVCNVLNLVFVEIVNEINRRIPINYGDRGSKYVKFADWKHLRQYISRHQRGWKRYESILKEVLRDNYGLTLAQFDRDITNISGIKGQRNRAFHPKVSAEQMRDRAVQVLTGGCLANETYSGTTLKLLCSRKFD